MLPLLLSLRVCRVFATLSGPSEGGLCGDSDGPLAAISDEPRQARKGATVVTDSGAEVRLSESPPSNYGWSSMTHQVLARKWRPTNFAEMVGQQHVLQALVNALGSGRLHHAYLFTGTRGVGKTTVARVLAKCFNCETGVTANPCGECGACLEIAEGRSVDLLEVDAASRRGIDATKELLENVQYAPSRDRYKIYLIDEVHMLTKESFNALLKTLEEPPSHVVFLFATTDPHQLPATVLSRCLQFNLKNMQPEQIVAHLKRILSAESVSADTESLALIARAAEGSMRDALSLTDQAIAYGKGRLTGADVAEMLGTADRSRVLDVVSAILDDDPASVLSLVAEIAEHAPDFVSTLDELSNILHQMTIAQTVPDALDTSWPDQARIVELAARATIDDSQLFWQMAVGGRREVHLASSARAGLEMILLRMIAFRPTAIFQSQHAVGDSLAKKPDPPASPVDPITESSLTRALDDGSSIVGTKLVADTQLNEVGVTGESQQTLTTPVTSDSHEEFGQINTKEDADATQSRDLLATSDDEVAPDDLFGEPRHEPQFSGETAAPRPGGSEFFFQSVGLEAAEEAPSEPLGLAALRTESWPELFEQFQFSGILHNIALNLELTEIAGATLRFSLSERDATLLNDRHPVQLSQALHQQLGQLVSAHIIVADHSGRTPASRRAALVATRLDDAEQAISRDDALHALIETFDGQIIPGSIRPNVADGEPEGHGVDAKGRV